MTASACLFPRLHLHQDRRIPHHAASHLGDSPVKVEVDVRYDFVADYAADTHAKNALASGRSSARQIGRANGQIHRWNATTETRARIKGPGFIDITVKHFAATPQRKNNFAHGIDYWRSRIDAAAGIDVYGNNGVAVGDFDGGGLDDFYVCQPSGLPNRLFRNRGDGTFEDVTESSGLGLLDGTASALFADFTN